jgi:hypothetical protein
MQPPIGVGKLLQELNAADPNPSWIAAGGTCGVHMFHMCEKVPGTGEAHVPHVCRAIPPDLGVPGLWC